MYFADVFKPVNHRIVNVVDPESEVLASIDQAFHTMLRRRPLNQNPLDMVCFYEELAVRAIGTVSQA